MSRIGKQPVKVPSGVTITVGKDNVLSVKGPKGELKQAIDRDITVEVKEGTVVSTVQLTRSVIVRCMVCTAHWLRIW
jgi:large subunit ribosomal protein L6